MTLHVVALPHAEVTDEHCACPFTTILLNFCKMMPQTILYAAEGSREPFVQIFSKEEKPNCNYKKDLYNVDWTGQASYWKVFNTNAIEAINQRKQKGDLICIVGGICQKEIAEAIPDLKTIEFSIGYSSPFSKYRVFESYAHMHRILGRSDGSFTETVIPNFLDFTKYDYQSMKEDYYLFVGRLIKRKGLALAIDICKQTNVKLKIAGQGCIDYGPNMIDTQAGRFEGNIEYIGVLDVQQRNQIMGKAKALIAPTLYVEPFGNVVIEAQACGTPAITTDWGGFTETVEQGKSGYRCRTEKQFLDAITKVNNLDTKYIHDRAKRLYSLEAVAPLYKEYFKYV